jgi:putative intracellular protease/amidase
MGRTIVALYPDCIAYEVMAAAEWLHPHFPVQVVTPEGADHLGSNGMTIRAAGAWRDVDPATVSVVLIPGGDAYDPLHRDWVSAWLQGLAGTGAIIGAICAGPVLLGAAGLLKGRRYTHGYRDQHQAFLAPYWAGATFTGAPVVVDGRLVTAKPEAHFDFAAALLVASGATSPDRAHELAHFYRGGRRLAVRAPKRPNSGWALQSRSAHRLRFGGDGLFAGLAGTAAFFDDLGQAGLFFVEALGVPHLAPEDRAFGLLQPGHQQLALAAHHRHGGSPFVVSSTMRLIVPAFGSAA